MERNRKREREKKEKEENKEGGKGTELCMKKADNEHDSCPVMSSCPG